MPTRGRIVALLLAEIAGSQHGVVARRQLLAAGMTSNEIGDRVRSGVLLREHRGVYRVGHRAPTIEARYFAAVLACGEGALLCGRAAAYLYELIAGAPPRAEVIAPRQVRVAGITTTRFRGTRPRTGAKSRGVPTVSVSETLVDLAAVLEAGALARACHEAGVRYATTPADIERALSARPHATGAGALRRVIHGEVNVSLSKLEGRFWRLLNAEGLPLPETNRVAGSRRVDCRWPAQQLTVELDGYRYHRSRHAWELDRNREREAYARGDDFRRYTYGDVFEHPNRMLAELARALLTDVAQGNTR